ncbi:hypothetical protein PoB_002219400 [Plakobranchus ocellatus]|uniref:Uncharacterized protein n=1 Tax=Plakobranchus ocellatus TaxID=259542 RepID=A0AAV3ZMS1_9GAST|nr:hypothetical protein PoB_002219400 [Plakobranchus ocellatus]
MAGRGMLRTLFSRLAGSPRSADTATKLSLTSDMGWERCSPMNLTQAGLKDDSTLLLSSRRSGDPTTSSGVNNQLFTSDSSVKSSVSPTVDFVRFSTSLQQHRNHTTRLPSDSSVKSSVSQTFDFVRFSTSLQQHRNHITRLPSDS